MLAWANLAYRVFWVTGLDPSVGAGDDHARQFLAGRPD